MDVCLRHLHLPGFTVYEQASRIQEFIFQRHLASRISKGGTGKVYTSIPPLHPQVLTFQTPPTYTCGRREIGKLTAPQVAHLKAGGKAEFFEAQRGGQTTFHGPGQLTAYVICNLLTHQLTSRRYVHLLEQSVIETCGNYGIEALRTENPGVWTKNEDKIASVGVHLRRYITSHGIALNISPDLDWFDRIVACGLPEKKATSFEREGVKGISIDNVAKTYAMCLSNLLPGVNGVIEVQIKPNREVLRMKQKYRRNMDGPEQPAEREDLLLIVRTLEDISRKQTDEPAQSDEDRFGRLEELKELIMALEGLKEKGVPGAHGMWLKARCISADIKWSCEPRGP